MPRVKIRSDLKAFTLSNFGGLNTQDDSTQIPGKAKDMLNVILAKEIRKRGGFEEVNSTAISGSTGIYGLFPYYYNNGANRKLIYSSHTTLGSMAVGTGTPTEITTGLTSNQRTRAVTFKDLFISVNGVDNPQKINEGTGADLGGSPPIVDTLALHKNYLFFTGNNTYPSRVYYCDLDTPETWGASSYFDVNPDDGDRTVGFRVTLDALIIYKEYNVYLLYGDTPTFTEGLTLWRIKKASTDTGAVNQGSIVEVNKNLIYLSRNKGFQTFGGGVTTSEVEFDSLTSATLSRDITPTITDLNESRFSQAEAINYDYKYICSVPNGSSTTNNLTLVYDYATGDWLPWDISANCWTVFRSSGVDDLYFGDPAIGKIYKYTPTTYSDNGTAIDAYYQTGDMDMSSKNMDLSPNDKIFRRYYLTLNKATDFNVGVDYEVDFGDSTGDDTVLAKSSDSVFGTAVFGTNLFGAKTTSSTRKDMNERGKFINYKFSNSTLNADMRIRNFTQYFRIRGAR